MNLPNKLTILRMIMIVPFVVFMLAPVGGDPGYLPEDHADQRLPGRDPGGVRGAV